MATSEIGFSIPWASLAGYLPFVLLTAAIFQPALYRVRALAAAAAALGLLHALLWSGSLAAALMWGLLLASALLLLGHRLRADREARFSPEVIDPARVAESHPGDRRGRFAGNRRLRLVVVAGALADLLAALKPGLKPIAGQGARLVEGPRHRRRTADDRDHGCRDDVGHCSTIASIARRGRTFASRSAMQVCTAQTARRRDSSSQPRASSDSRSAYPR